MWRYGRSEALIYAVTLGVVAEDLLTGVLVGFGLSVAKLVYQFSHLSVRLERDPGHGKTTLHLEGAATFLRLPKLAQTLESVPPAAELHVHFEQLSHIDHACLELLVDWEKRHAALGGSLVVDWDTLPLARPRPGPSGSG